jgi:hypothetical protein
MLPHATTTITVLRVADDPNRDPYDPKPAPAEIHTGVRAHIGSPTGREQVAGGSQSITDTRLTCDPIDLHHQDQVRDDTTGETFEVVWVKQRTGLGLPHVTAFLKHLEGLA